MLTCLKIQTPSKIYAVVTTGRPSWRGYNAELFEVDLLRGLCRQPGDLRSLVDPVQHLADTHHRPHRGEARRGSARVYQFSIHTGKTLRELYGGAAAAYKCPRVPLELVQASLVLLYSKFCQPWKAPRVPRLIEFGNCGGTRPPPTQRSKASCSTTRATEKPLVGSLHRTENRWTWLR